MDYETLKSMYPPPPPPGPPPADAELAQQDDLDRRSFFKKMTGFSPKYLKRKSINRSSVSVPSREKHDAKMTRSNSIQLQQNSLSQYQKEKKDSYNAGEKVPNESVSRSEFEHADQSVGSEGNCKRKLFNKDTQIRDIEKNGETQEKKLEMRVRRDDDDMNNYYEDEQNMDENYGSEECQEFSDKDYLYEDENSEYEEFSNNTHSDSEVDPQGKSDSSMIDEIKAFQRVNLNQVSKDQQDRNDKVLPSTNSVKQQVALKLYEKSKSLSIPSSRSIHQNYESVKPIDSVKDCELLRKEVCELKKELVTALEEASNAKQQLFEVQKKLYSNSNGNENNQQSEAQIHFLADKIDELEIENYALKDKIKEMNDRKTAENTFEKKESAKVLELQNEIKLISARETKALEIIIDVIGKERVSKAIRTSSSSANISEVLLSQTSIKRRNDTSSKQVKNASSIDLQEEYEKILLETANGEYQKPFEQKLRSYRKKSNY